MATGRDWCGCCQCVAFRNQGASIRRFIERLHAEDAMKDTQVPKSGPGAPYGNVFLRTLADEFANEPKACAEAVEKLFIEHDKLRADLDRQRAINESLRIEHGQRNKEDAIFRADRKRTAAVLATFYRSTLSMSSVQPLLALAEELNPSLRETK